MSTYTSPIMQAGLFVADGLLLAGCIAISRKYFRDQGYFPALNLAVVFLAALLFASFCVETYGVVMRQDWAFPDSETEEL